MGAWIFASGDLVMSVCDTRRLALRNQLSELKRLTSWIEDRVDPARFPDLSLAVQVCLEEAVANVIMYASPDGDQLEIWVDLGRCEGVLVARVEDNGREFDPTQAAPFRVAKSLQDAQVGNIGIHLMRSFADGVDYERRNGRNQLTLRFVEPRPA